VKVYIGSLRQPKVQAVKNIFEKLSEILTPEVKPQFNCKSVQSNVSEMPTTQIEIMQGARNRALNMLHSVEGDNREDAFFIGMEGGVYLSPIPEYHSQCYLQSWVFVSDRQKGYFGASPAMPLTNTLKNSIFEEGGELGELIDLVAKQSGIRSKEGAFGVLSKGFLDRQTIFENALLAAMAPFYNQELYT